MRKFNRLVLPAGAVIALALGASACGQEKESTSNIALRNSHKPTTTAKTKEAAVVIPGFHDLRQDGASVTFWEHKGDITDISSEREDRKVHYRVLCVGDAITTQVDAYTDGGGVSVAQVNDPEKCADRKVTIAELAVQAEAPGGAG